MALGKSGILVSGFFLIWVGILLTGSGCQTGLVPDLPIVIPDLNTTDPTNNGAKYIGSQACYACHPDKGSQHILHGHAHKVTKLAGGPPIFPAENPFAVVPNPPDNTTWGNLTYVIGGYHRKARFINSQGYIMTNGVDKVNTQWNLTFPPNGTVASWGSYEPAATSPKPYGYSCFYCHTTGPNSAGNQDSLPGITGTFAETGIQCESCHGPGSNHIPTPPSNIYINTEAVACGSCHSRGVTSEISGLQDKDVIPASGGFIRHHEQYQELLASPHASFKCVTCHSPHISTALKKDEGGIVNTCQSCHPTHTLPLHAGKVFVWGDYVERLSCVSCHMPFAAKSATSASTNTVGPLARVGDIRTHIWYINTNPVNYTAMFSADGKQVAKDAAGHAAVTVDFVCLRCHSGKGNAFDLTIKSAADIAYKMHLYSP